MSATTTDLPLAGIRVADFSRVLAGPYATMMLADFGADVIKIESPDGDDTRSWRPPVDAAGDSTYFAAVNRNKRSIVCDLRMEAGLATAHRLAAGADIVVENFRPGVMERFGLDEATLRADAPGLVYCSITGFGRGDGAALAGYDLLVQAVGGLMSITGAPDSGPTKVGVALVDVLTGLNAFSGMLLALRERDRTGLGQRIDVDLLTSLLAALTNQASSTLATGIAPARMGNAHPSIAPYELVDASDRPFVVAVGNDRQFRDFVGLLGRPELADDPRFARNADRVRHRQALRDELMSTLAGNTAAHWVDRCATARVPAGLVNDLTEAFAFAASLGLDPVARIDQADATGTGTTRSGAQPANPIHLSSAPADYRSVAPRLGEHDGADWHPQPHPQKEGRP
ncbi:CaiB/BaiF CoA transferase family protein [Leifsonia poae]|uniref:CaiB/BaiF CoA transferase family protein n=1 Tax=Leifsonia poae TaxID=110933 RepID=UPI001CBD1B89|nr:CoA transferase [Leifsonia poae]